MKLLFSIILILGVAYSYDLFNHLLSILPVSWLAIG